MKCLLMVRYHTTGGILSPKYSQRWRTIKITLEPSNYRPTAALAPLQQLDAALLNNRPVEDIGYRQLVSSYVDNFCGGHEAHVDFRPGLSTKHHLFTIEFIEHFIDMTSRQDV
jgi:hypothetical protein